MLYTVPNILFREQMYRSQYSTLPMSQYKPIATPKIAKEVVFPKGKIDHGAFFKQNPFCNQISIYFYSK